MGRGEENGMIENDPARRPAAPDRADASSAAPSRRELDRRRIKLATSWLAVIAAVATAVFAGLAASATKHARAGGSTSGGSFAGGSSAGEDTVNQDDDDGFLTLTPPSSPPQQSFGAPSATSGGS
jgi:hypothetical protein